MNDQFSQPLPPQGKVRHGCLTAWLILMLIANPITILLYLFGGDTYAHLPGWFVPTMILFSLINVGAAILLFKWKKLGFWFFCGSALFVFIINLTVGMTWYLSFGGLVGVLLLFGILNIGKENKGWTQLE
ncbi:MAG: hypothetical protein MUO40_03290 [Anaerolineaceae bacterium]|nr:hypothetical protein [Anaerolineaceae bacterium]